MLGTGRRPTLVIAAALWLGCSSDAPTPIQPEPCAETTLVVVTIYGDTARFDDYAGPPPENLAGVRKRWWECPSNPQETP